MPVEPPFRADERASLVGFLAAQRATLERKCAGLDAEALARRAVEPSALSLLGLVRHLADVERGWFREVLAARGRPTALLLGHRPRRRLPRRRWVLLHVIEEYARRNGHADLLREQIDGSVGL